MDIKVLLLLFLLQFPAIFVLGQVDSANKAFVYETLSGEPGFAFLTYTDKLNYQENTLFFNTLKKPKIVGYERPTGKKVKLKLSSTDKRQLFAYIKAAENFEWQDALFENSRLIPVDSLWQDNSRRIKGMAEFARLNSDINSKKSLVNEIVTHCSTFQFSNPIFLKDRTIVIFYFRRICGGSCGIEDLSVYKLQNGVYKKWIILGGVAY